MGYELAGIAEVPQHMITSPGYRPANWTLFTNPDFRFYQNMLRNHRENRAAMTEFLYTHAAPDGQCVRGQYVSVPPSGPDADDPSSSFQEFVYKPE